MKLPSRTLGKTGVKLPVLGFGTAPSGLRLTLRSALPLYEEALSLGISYFDTAPEFAGYGKAQEQLGYLVKDRRNEIFLVTKCFEPSGEAALRLLQRSLKELQTDHADLVFVHSLGADKMDPRVVFGRDGCYQALMKAKDQGLTRFVGFSGHNRPHRFLKAIKTKEIDVLLNAVNFADRHTYDFERTVWPVAIQMNIGLIAMKVYGGARTTPFAGLSHCLMPKAYLDDAFRYALGFPQVACAVIGMATQEELYANIRRAAQATALSAREMNELDRIGKSLAREWGSNYGAAD
ncbi:aldo/keto reductase [Petrachloros mirabilis]